MKEMIAAMTNSRICITVSVGLGILLAAHPARSETPANIIAAQLRMQGYACEDPVDATRDRKASKPNVTVWTLRCKNAAYRVQLIPDMAAHVTQLK
jgi:hypothetical protein